MLVYDKLSVYIRTSPYPQFVELGVKSLCRAGCNPGEAARDDGAEKEGYPEEGREHTIRYVTDRMRGRVPPFMPVSQSRRGWYQHSPGPWPGVEIR